MIAGASTKITAKVLFTADTHFGHGGALGMFRRPFASVAEMDEALVERWNARVAAIDTVWHLGDFGVRLPRARVADLLDRLHGTKRLVAGNTDGPGVRAAAGWASVQDYAELELEGRWLILCHYPFRTWNRAWRGAINLHGHSHGRLPPGPRQIDVGVDVWDFRPVSLAEILARQRARKCPDRG